MGRYYLALAISLLVPAICFAGTLSGVVVGIKDGDTIYLLTPDRQKKEVRFNAIDAPEKAQPFYNKSQQSLSNLCAGKDATVNTYGLDKYGRTLGDVFCQGKSANVHQVENGYAWVYRQYSNDANLIALEAAARSKGIGLWNDPSPIPPWDFRHGKRPETFEQTQARVKASANSAEGFSCGSKRYCRQMVSCEEARFYLKQCGLHKLDKDGDGVPCEVLCGG
ncbi:nuclease [Methylotenera oryzisoli]|uniref:Nuclease n=1 Tax=Methylotenera oryzisoli TaxID=2080758 RepID=A0A4Y9VQV4_9PROT|nr:thermonuclease family protein [Methylotenera oryzisoli]TFW71497.1 nuclease [Methylotenera oryzisoli]